MRSEAPGDAVVVGAGCVSALGRGLASTYDALDTGAVAVKSIPGLGEGVSAARAEPPLLRREVPRELEPQIKFLNGAGELAVEATAEAVDAARPLGATVPDTRRGLYLSQMESEDWLCSEFAPAFEAATEDLARPVEAEALNRASARRVKPFFMLESLKNNAFSFLATMFELRGANTSVAGFAGPTHLALDLAMRSLARGSLDEAVVVGAARPTSSVALAEMAIRGIPQPPGDGAAALVLRRRADVPAQAVQATVLGLASATHATDPDAATISSEALGSAARVALEEAGMDPGGVRVLIAPGLGEVLGEIPVLAGLPHTSWAHALGHCSLAWETMQTALGVQCLRAGRVPGGEAWEPGGAILILGAGLLGQASAVVLGP